MATTNYVWDLLNDIYLMETDEGGVTTAVYTQEPSHYGGLINQKRGADNDEPKELKKSGIQWSFPNS